MPDCFGVPVVISACVLFSFAHKAAGAIVAPAFPAPSDFLEGRCCRRTRASHAAGMPKLVIAREAKQSMHPRHGLRRRFAPRNDGGELFEI
jgi:hypothetical protein